MSLKEISPLLSSQPKQTEGIEHDGEASPTGAQDRTCMKSIPVRGTASAGSWGKHSLVPVSSQGASEGALCEWAAGLWPEMLAGAHQEACLHLGSS